MDGKEYLEQIRTINLKILAISEEIAEIRSVLGVQAIRYDRIPGTTSNTDKTFTLICQLIDKQNELMQEYVYLSDKKQEIKGVLYRLSKQVYAEILYKKYFEFKKMPEIANEMYYSLDHIKKLHRDALAEVEEITRNNTE